MSDDAIVNLSIPRGISLLYEPDAQRSPMRHDCGDVADAESAAAATAFAFSQGKA